MENWNVLGPIVSGVVGGLITLRLTKAWAKWVPTVFNGKAKADLLSEHRVAIYTANGLFYTGILGGLALYLVAGFARTDWRPAALGFGFASVGPLVSLFVLSVALGRNPKEAYVAFAISQRTPLSLVYGVLAVGVAAFCAAIASLV